MRTRFFLAVLLTAPTAAIAAPGDRLCVTAEHLAGGLAVKARPTAEAETIMTIGAGRVVIEFDRTDGWIQVGIERAGGRDGYVPAEAVSQRDLDGLPCGS